MAIQSGARRAEVNNKGPFISQCKLDFIVKTGERLKDFQLRWEGDRKLCQVPLSNIVENTLEGAPAEIQTTQHIFQTCSSLTLLLSQEDALLSFPFIVFLSGQTMKGRLPSGQPPIFFFSSSPCWSRLPCKYPKKRCFIGRSSQFP